jgi:hypothetical protein
MYIDIKHRRPLGTDHTENTTLLLLRAYLLGFPLDRYPGSPLARLLLSSNGRSTDTKRTHLLLLFVRLNVFAELLPSNGFFGSVA